MCAVCFILVPQYTHPSHSHPSVTGTPPPPYNPRFRVPELLGSGAGTGLRSAPAKAAETAPIEGEGTLRHRIKKAIQVPPRSTLPYLASRHPRSAAGTAPSAPSPWLTASPYPPGGLRVPPGCPRQDAEERCQDAVKAALADAGTIAWADRNLDLAKAWAVRALGHDAKSLGKVAAWTKGAKAFDEAPWPC
jgi:hypothetical protein